MASMHVIFWSQTGNTEAMASAIAEGAKGAGAAVDLKSVGDTNVSAALDCDLLALGCPAMGDEVLEESEFDPFFTDLEGRLAGRKVALFGSYGWGDGQWMRDWQDRVQKAGAVLFQGEGLILNETPDDDGIAKCKEFGAAFANS